MMQSLHHRTLVCSFVFFFFSFLFNPQIALAQPDTIPPTLNCPGNLTINTPFSGCDTILNYTVTAFDNEPGVVFEQVEGIPSGDPYPMGLTKNTFLATDAAGNTSSCQFTIRLTFGGIVCADMSFIYLDAQCQASITSPQILEGLTQYSCPDSFKVDYDPTFAGPPANGPWYPANNLSAIDAGKLYYVRVTDRFTGNSCWGQIRILDTVAPQPICPNISIPLNVPDSLSSPAALVNILGFPAGNITYQDNCTVADTITYFDNLNIINCNAGGNVQRTINRLWSATDLYGNTGTCLQKIQFRRDPEDIIFPPDVSLSCKDAPATTAVT